MQLIPNGTITSPKGFLAAGIYCGIKKSKKKDLALIYSEVLASAAAVFTTNQVKAIPVILSKKLIKQGEIQYIVINSGNANCCTGKLGLKNAQKMVEVAGKNALVASTGKIGEQLPMHIICKGIEQLKKKLTKEGGKDASEAILTTDKVPKRVAVKLPLGGKVVTIGGAAKGSGMIYPRLRQGYGGATMIAVITTDAKLDSKLLQKILNKSVESTFNMISVDGDMSTNDTVFALANGQSRTPPIKEGTKEYQKFSEAFEWVCAYLAKEIVKDGEGARRFVEVEVRGAGSDKEAKVAARAIVNSNLVKTAIFGGDPNWGRIMGALGASGIEFNPDRVDIKIGKEQIVKNGVGVKYNKSKIAELFRRKEIKIVINLKSGTKSAVAWGCDLTYDYVRINAKYYT